MYEHSQPVFGRSTRICVGLLACTIAAACAPYAAAQQVSAAASDFTTPNIIRHISRQSERLEMTSNASRVLTLDKNIPKVQVNNPELVAVTPLSAKQVLVAAKKPGVTQVNLWDEEDNVHTLDVIIYGDVRELEFALKTQFPNSSVGVRKFSQSLMLTGFVDSPDHVGPITRLAEDYAPKVINNLEVGGVQQVLLKVKVFEVSRTKLRRLNVDWAHVSSGGGFIASKPNGLISGITGGATTTITDTGGATLEFGIVSGNNNFFGFLDALQQNNIAKILAEPNIVSVSGRPAQFLEGGEIPIIVPQGLGTSSIEFKPFGTQVDFLPIVLGNGNIHLDVRPRVSSLDESIGVELIDQRIPGFRVRQADTAVEMRAGQTFALAGLIERRTESVNKGLPFLSDIPVIGVPFRGVEEVVNEIELLILVTPEFVDAMDPHEVPPCGPGMGTMSPSNCELYFGGQLEVPNAYGPCGAGCEGGAGCNGCQGYNQGAAVPMGQPSMGQPMEHYPMSPTEAVTPAGESIAPQGIEHEGAYEALPSAAPTHGELQMPDIGANRATSGPALREARRPANGYAAPRTGNFRRAVTQTAPPTVPSPARSDYSIEGGLIGPVGYDVE